MKITTLVLSAAALLLLPSWAQVASAADAETVTAICKDGTPYEGKTLRGACRGHGGVDKEATAAKAQSAPPVKKAKAEQPAAPTAAAAAEPETVTAICKDGTPYEGKTLRGACRGHGGVDKEATAARAAAPAPTRTATSRTVSQAAPGGGAGRVWVNTDSKVYHCDGDRYYGKTKQGEYMSESAVTANGFRPAGGKTCSG